MTTSLRSDLLAGIRLANADLLEQWPLTATSVNHIRAKGDYRADKRFRFNSKRGGRAIVNRAGTICGADTTYDDIDKKTAAHLVKSVANAGDRIAHWLADVCPASDAPEASRQLERHGWTTRPGSDAYPGWRVLFDAGGTICVLRSSLVFDYIGVGAGPSENTTASTAIVP